MDMVIVSTTRRTNRIHERTAAQSVKTSERRENRIDMDCISWTSLVILVILTGVVIRLITMIRVLKVRLAQAHGRLMMDGGEPHYRDCCDYSDGLVIKGQPRFGNLSRLEWMLRVVVGYSRRQDEYLKKLEGGKQR